MFQEHNFIKKRPSRIVAGKKRAKCEVHVVCVCFFIDFSLRQHGLLVYFTFTPSHSTLACLQVLVSDYFSSPKNPFKQFLPLATTKIFSSFRLHVEWWNLFFSSRRSWWNGGSTNCFVFSCTLTQLSSVKNSYTKLHRKPVFPLIQGCRRGEWKSEQFTHFPTLL